MPETRVADGIVIRHARRHEIPAIRAMQERSLVLLGSAFYSATEIAAFLALAGTMDDAVVDEGHYFVGASRIGAIMASGGWSLQGPGYDRARALGAADGPEPGTATVRSVFVDPTVARCGLASALMAHVERDAARHGIRVLRLMATLSGLAFYTRLGWRPEGEKAIALPGELLFDCVSMSKPVMPGHGAAANDALRAEEELLPRSFRVA